MLGNDTPCTLSYVARVCECVCVRVCVYVYVCHRLQQHSSRLYVSVCMELHQCCGQYHYILR